MKLKMMAILAAALSLSLWACNNGPNLDIRTFTLENRSAYEAAELIGPYVFTDREQNPGAMSATSNALTVRETPDNLEKIARVLAEFDQPIPTLRLRFQLIEADSFADEDPAIADVTAELRSLFQFEGYRLLGEALVTVAGGTMEEQEANQSFLGPDQIFSVQLAARVERPGSIRLNPVRLWAGDSDVLLETSVNVAEGQTVVIGGGRTRGGEGAYILTVRAEAG
jgi:hypothetical protein